MAQEILHPVKVATTINITLANGVIPDSANEDSNIDGVRLLVGDRILVKSQSDFKQNGIYEVSNNAVSVGSSYKQLVRSSDFADSSTHDATVVFVRQGDTLADTGFILSTDTTSGITVGTSDIQFKRFTVNDTTLNDVSSFLTLRSEKGYPLTNAELDNNFKYLGNALNDKVDNAEYSAEAIIDKINSLSYEEAGIDASLLRGMIPSIIVPVVTPQIGSIVVRDPDGDITTNVFIGDLDGSADRLDGEHGSYYLNMDNPTAGTLAIARGGTDASTAAQARINLNVVNKSGDTLTGRLIFKPGQTGLGGNASFNIPPGQESPTTTEDGDVWASSSSLYYKLNNTVEKIAPINSPIFTGEPRISATATTLNASGNIVGDGNRIPTFALVQSVKDHIDTQLNLKAPINSPALTGTPTITSAMPAISNSSTRIPTTAWVQDVKSDFLTNTIVPTYETKAVVATKSPIASPTFTGYARINYTALPGPANSENILATAEWVQSVKQDFLTNTIAPTYATYNYVNTSAPWKGSNKFVSINLPTPSDGVAGDIWIQTSDILVTSEINDSIYLRRDGDTALNYITLHADPTSASHAATKNYVDTSAVSKSGTTMTGYLTLHANPTNALHAATKQYVDSVDVSATAVMKSGSTMTGFLTLSGAPTSNLHAATKKYVDDEINNFSANVSGVPLGTVTYYTSSSIPAGWMECDGRSLSTTTYAALFSIIGYRFGGSGSTFNIPDLRGEFIRGWDHGRGIDTSRTLGSFQRGSAVLVDDGNAVLGPARDINGTSNSTVNSRGSNYQSPDLFYDNYDGFGNIAHATAVLSVGYNNYYSAVSEPTYFRHSRPRNVALVACIKAIGAVDDPNQILAADVLADVSAKLSRSGGTMTGYLTLHASPTNNFHAATKAYVDTKLTSVAVPTPSANFDIGSYIFATNADQIYEESTENAYTGGFVAAYGSTQPGSKLRLAGIRGIGPWYNGPVTEVMAGTHTGLTRRNDTVIPGTWRCMGYAGNPDDSTGAYNTWFGNLWVRIA